MGAPVPLPTVVKYVHLGVDLSCLALKLNHQRKSIVCLDQAMLTPKLRSQTSFEYTSTRSSFVMDVAGVVEMNITFLSSITPTDLMRQSLIFSYVDVSVTSTDGAAHDVQLYTDITARKPFGSIFLSWPLY